ncbi:MAG: N-acetyltransferase [Lewinellaceae bacterium]|nr:N-acetyltransferase [Saprospiraceae bacterium]MCB9307584.1 N-acetyltransferase [Lewinellaceae bacterium]MCB9354548.1 N-acetyltransferase [Lewinellaceae bacterium]
MDIKLDTDGKKGAFFVEGEGKRLAEMAFTMAGAHKMIIDHTDVDDSLRGQGVGRKLLDALLPYVREHEIKVIPLCPYAKSVFEKDASIRDVLL